MKFTTTFKTAWALPAAVGLVLCAPATASSFSVSSGVGGPIVGGVGGVMSATLPTLSSSSTVVVARPVTAITSVTITGITHTWVGDVHFVLRNPAGVRTNVFCRPGFTGAGFGSSGDFLGGTYTFVSPPTPGLPGAGNPAPGTYGQSFSTWVSGGAGVSNASFSTVTGAAGVWTLEAYDWDPADSGAWTGWTLAGTDTSVVLPAAYCFGDGTGTACPCDPGQSGGAGRGCANSNPAHMGCLLTATGSTSVAANDLTLTSTGMMDGSYCIFLQGDASLGLGALSPFYDGIQCVGGNLVRLGRFTTLGSTTSQAGIAGLGGAAGGDTRYYQTVYRNAIAFCTPATLNTSNGMAVAWIP